MCQSEYPKFGRGLVGACGTRKATLGRREWSMISKTRTFWDADSTNI